MAVAYLIFWGFVIADDEKFLMYQRICLDDENDTPSLGGLNMWKALSVHPMG